GAEGAGRRLAERGEAGGRDAALHEQAAAGKLRALHPLENFVVRHVLSPSSGSTADSQPARASALATSSIETGRRSARERSAASATSSAARASSRLHGLSPPARTASTNAASSAWYAGAKRSRKFRYPAPTGRATP